MPQPIDYLPKPLDFTQALQGLQIGSTIRASRERSQAADQAAALKQQYATDLEAAFADPTAEAFARLTAKYPQQREAFKQSLSMISDEQRENELALTGQVYSALQSGNVEVATGILDDRIEALKNSGGDASKLKMLRDNMERDPTNAMGFAGLLLSSSMGPEKFADTFSKVKTEERAAKLDPIKKKKEQQDLLSKASELELTKARTNKVLSENRKLDAETKKAILELESLKATGGKDPAKVFDQEKKLRDEYVKRTASFSAAQDAFTKVEESAKDKSGAGDIALITSFMKMLDPGSVVRETEFATAQDTGGYIVKLKNALTKAQTGQFLTDKQRTEFSGLAKRYMSAAEKQEKGVRAGLNKVVKNYSLNPENVFGVIEEEVVTETPEATERKVIRVTF